MRFLPGLIILVLVFYGGSAFGEEIPAGQPFVPDNVMPAKRAISADEGYVDRSHAFFDRKINATVAWFDDLFGKTGRREPRKADIQLRWSNELRAEEGESVKYRSSINAHLHLPRLEKKFRLVIIQETREDAIAPVPSDPGTPIANTPTQANTLRAVNTELRFYARDTKTGYAFLAVGSRFVWLPETFVRGRFLWRHALADNTFISPSVTPFWQDHIGFGVTPQLDFGHPFAHDYIFLWANSATVFKNRSGFLWGSEVSLSRILSPVTAIAFAVGANGATRPSVVADRFHLGANNYMVSFKYRRKIYRPWLFLELVPEANWRMEEAGGREVIPAFTARLEINSEGARALLPVPVIVKEQLPVPGLHYEPINP
ncbi:hypothetical protein [Candidatus Deferrimicrobium sp.]|uniref:hypothetical protein n=1 Tax=Candidatus Deferrimicrobium sp. TaxID=3060586 RepID=UPI003C681246